MPSDVSAPSHWIKSLFVQTCHFSKIIRLMNPAKPKLQIRSGEGEDLVLTETGLDSYAEMLVQGDPACKRAVASPQFYIPRKLLRR